MLKHFIRVKILALIHAAGCPASSFNHNKTQTKQPRHKSGVSHKTSFARKPQGGGMSTHFLPIGLTCAQSFSLDQICNSNFSRREGCIYTASCFRQTAGRRRNLEKSITKGTAAKVTAEGRTRTHSFLYNAQIVRI